MGGSNGNGSSKKRNAKKRGRDELPSAGIAFRRAARQRKLNISKRFLSNTVINKYANRRTSWFKTLSRPSKACFERARVCTHVELWNQKGYLYRIGDIVSVRDDDDGKLYFAQIRYLLSDDITGRYAFLTWMIPKKTAQDVHTFSLADFVAGAPDMEHYPLDMFEFVEHGTLPNHDSALEEIRKYRTMGSRDELFERVKDARNQQFDFISFDERLEPRELPPC